MLIFEVLGSWKHSFNLPLSLCTVSGYQHSQRHPLLFAYILVWMLRWKVAGTWASILPATLMNHALYKRHGGMVHQLLKDFFFFLPTEFPILTSQLLNPVFWSCFYPTATLTFHRREGHVWFPLNSAIVYYTPQLMAFQLSKSRGDVCVLPPHSLWYYSAIKSSRNFCAHFPPATY